jgi:hypothetical protein
VMEMKSKESVRGVVSEGYLRIISCFPVTLFTLNNRYEMGSSWASKLCLTLFIASLSTAHFTINYPSPLGVDANNEGIGPCGGFSFSASSNVTEFHVDGDAIALVTTHPQANILFRGTLDKTASSNWTNLFPIVGQYGLGAYCQPSIVVPASWTGSGGIIQVIENAVDGMLYQVKSLLLCSVKLLTSNESARL